MTTFFQVDQIYFSYCESFTCVGCTIFCRMFRIFCSAQLVQLRDQLRNQGLGNLVPELNNALNLEQDGVPPAPGAAPMPEPVAAVHQDDLNLPNLQIPAGLGHLGNILQIPNMLHGLNADPLPPPPPMPPVDLSKLSQDELELMESVERKGLEGTVSRQPYTTIGVGLRNCRCSRKF